MLYWLFRQHIDRTFSFKLSGQKLHRGLRQQNGQQPGLDERAGGGVDRQDGGRRPEPELHAGTAQSRRPGV